MVFNYTNETNGTNIFSSGSNSYSLLYFLVPFFMIISFFIIMYFLCKFCHRCFILIVLCCLECSEPENKSNINKICIIIFRSPSEKIMEFEEIIVNS